LFDGCNIDCNIKESDNIHYENITVTFDGDWLVYLLLFGSHLSKVLSTTWV
jgi:hypothetical protein